MKLILRNTILFLFLLFFVQSLNAQNLVPNPGFESNNKLLATWMRNDLMFEQMTNLWTSPNQGSPDIIGTKAIPYWGPKRKGVDLTPNRPRTGEVMMAIKTYGCDAGTQHCKEYLQVELRESLTTGEEYYAEFWVSPISTSIRTNNFGMAVSDVEIQDESEYGIYYFDPVIEEKAVIDVPAGQWVKISGTFTADFMHRNILIGNFRPDEETEIKKGPNSIKYAYYMIDDVIVRPVNSPENLSIGERVIERGETIHLDNIFFEHDQSTLLPRSFQQLDELIAILKSKPDFSIKIGGHTDSTGEAAYNLDLSAARAAAVADYLEQKGIDKERLESAGYGELQPIADNATEEGRQANRRVTFTVL